MEVSSVGDCVWQMILMMMRYGDGGYECRVVVLS